MKPDGNMNPQEQIRRTEMGKSESKCKKCTNIHLPFFLIAASLIDIKLYYIIIIMMNCICNIYRCNIYDNNSTKREYGKQSYIGVAFLFLVGIMLE